MELEKQSSLKFKICTCLFSQIRTKIYLFIYFKKTNFFFVPTHFRWADPNNSPVQTAPIQFTCPKSKVQKCSITQNLNFELSDNNNNINIVSPKINKALSRSFKKTFHLKNKYISQILISLPQIWKLSRLSDSRFRR